ncbi:hypothetical protein [Caulobacter sp. CCG-8]|uniref:hypothetical protein n=1 Tax=Caulobacter sp. CCG-8 TaxID=3127958 RepID=UPI00307F2907
MPEALGNFTQDEIRGLAQEVQIPERAGTSPTERFVRQISELVALRVAAGEDKGVSIILRSDALESDVEGKNCERVPYLRNGQDAISQKIFVSNTVLGLAYAIHVDDSAADQMAAVQQAGLGGLPALIIDWRGAVPKAALYGSGVDDPGDVEDVYLTETDITPEDLKAGLDEFYTKRLRTPSLVVQGNSVRIWAEGKAAQGWPADRPEEKIQGVLMSFLHARYSRFEVRAEVVNEDGRLDLKIFAKLFDATGAKIIKNVWVLELKALTDRTTTGTSQSAAKIDEAIEKGLTQAISYKDAEHVNQAALCCFDMRATDLGPKTFEKVAQEANDNDVHLWRWYLYRSAEASRLAKREERLAAARPAEA